VTTPLKNDLLTTKQLMERLHLDRTTIYRMLNKGQLPAMRIGGQWRFSREAIEAWLQERSAYPLTHAHGSVEETDTIARADQDLPLSCFQVVQEVFAQTSEIGAVTTDLNGNLLTHFSNSCAFCELVLSTAEGRANCQASWKRLAEQNDVPPRPERCHAGLTYLRGRVILGNASVAIFFAGQFVPESSQEGRKSARLTQVARACAVDAKKLKEAMQSVRVLPQVRVEQLLNLSQLVADNFSHIARTRVDLLSRLEHVVQIAQISAP
jgi:excisionase family DNA binding protein